MLGIVKISSCDFIVVLECQKENHIFMCYWKSSKRFLKVFFTLIVIANKPRRAEKNRNSYHQIP